MQHHCLGEAHAASGSCVGFVSTASWLARMVSCVHVLLLAVLRPRLLLSHRIPKGDHELEEDDRVPLDHRWYGHDLSEAVHRFGAF